MIRDLAIVGGGPAGLALATHAARAGLSVALFDRQILPVDKPCGEGVMPAGVRALETLGVLSLLSAEDVSRFVGIRYVQEDGSEAEIRLRHGGGLGVRRTALTSALLRRAIEAGAEIHAPRRVLRHAWCDGGVTVETADGPPLCARMLVAADGLHSPLRRAEGLEAPARGPRRFGLRRHFRLAPWSDRVEVHLSREAEAYVTPCGSNRVGVAFLWEDGRLPGRIEFDAVLSRFPLLLARLREAEPESRPQGAGPFLHSSRALTKDRFALLGDAAGYVDALTGEGVALGLRCAEVLARVLPDALARGATREALAPYERFARTAFRRYALGARAMLAFARRPRLRRVALGLVNRAKGAMGTGRDLDSR